MIALMMITSPIWISIIVFSNKIHTALFGISQKQKNYLRLRFIFIAIAFLVLIVFASLPFVFGLLFLQIIFWGLCFSALVILGHRSIFYYVYNTPKLFILVIVFAQIFTILILWDLFVWTNSFSIFLTIGLPIFKFWFALQNINTLIMIVPKSLSISLALSLFSIAMFLSVRRFRIFIPSIAIFVFLGSLLLTADKEAQASMCAQASILGIDSFHRFTFLQSVRELPFEFTVKWHAVFEANGDIYGWSYEKMNWYKIEERKKSDAKSGDLFECKMMEFIN